MKLNKSQILFLCIFLIFISVNAQQSIQGKVVEDNGEALPFANALLLKMTDSTLVKGGITEENGVFLFERIPKGKYIITVSMLGFDSKTTQPFLVDKGPPISIPTIALNGSVTLDEVEIIAKKPLYVQKIDRMVINVASSILSAGTSALEVLERSPGVIINRQNGSISLIGKDGVQVMINGKLSYMPQSSLVQLLEGMSSDNIETIELITTPPANFDAEGNAGFINIVLKEQTDVGLNGAYSFSGGFGNGTVTSDNISFNYRKNKLNFFGNYSFLRRSQGQTFKFARSFINENGIPIDLATVSDRDPIQRNHNVRFGLDYQTSDKTVMGILITAYDNKWTMDALNESLEKENGVPSSFVELLNTERNQWQHFSSNINLKHNFEENEFISFNVDYLYYNDENPTNYTNSFFDGTHNFLKEELTNSDKTTPINIVVSKADYSKKLNDKLKLEAGIKAAFSNFENDVSVETFDGQAFIEDPTLTNKSNLDERIFAAYTSLDYKINEKMSLKLGLRYEHTNSELDSDIKGKVVDRSFGELFPSAFISHKVNDSLSFNLSYSRRITRPTFNDMAPFVIFVDPTTFFAGNPAIQPAISNSVKFDTNYRSLLVSIQYSIEDESISRFQERFDEGNDRLFFEAANLDQTKIFTLTLGLPFTIANWWKMQNNFIYLNTKISNTIDGSLFNFEQNTFNINSTQSFTLAKNLTSEININYFGPSLFGFAKYDEIFSMSVGIQKKFSDEWGTLKFSINDIWDSFEFNGGTDIPEQNLNTRNTFDFSNRTFILTYSRNFGNKKLKAARERKTGAEEERKRVN